MFPLPAVSSTLIGIRESSHPGSFTAGVPLSLPSNGTLDVPFHLCPFYFFAFVVKLAALAESQLNLDQSPGVEIDFQRHQGKSFFMGQVGELAYLALVQQQLPGTSWFVVPLACLRVFGDITSNQPDLAITNPAIGFLQ